MSQRSTSIYIDTAELLNRVAWSPRKLARLVSSGALVCGRHFFQPVPRGDRLYRWDAIVEWIEGRSEPTPTPRVQRRAPVDVAAAEADLARLLG